jgi:hypothetical protein
MKCEKPSSCQLLGLKIEAYLILLYVGYSQIGPSCDTESIHDVSTNN